MIKVILYDTTLRDGNQDPRLHLNLADKLELAELISDFGLPYVEGGWQAGSGG